MKSSFYLAAIVILIIVASCTFSHAQTTTTTFSHIEQMAPLRSCDICSGAGGAGTTAVHRQTQFQTTPSPSRAWSQFLFWRNRSV